MLFVFCFKQKTAYKMRISDWSSDVCSSDLVAEGIRNRVDHFANQGKGRKPVGFKAIQLLDPDLLAYVGLSYTFRQIPSGGALTNLKIRIGRARSEERRVGKECVSKCRSRWSSYH